VSLVISTSAVDCLERFISKITCYVLSVMLNFAHSLSHSQGFLKHRSKSVKSSIRMP